MISPTDKVRQSVAAAADHEIDWLVKEIRDALQENSADQQHDALVSVAGFLGVEKEVAA